MNNVTFVGEIAQDLKIETMQTGREFVKFNVAVNDQEDGKVTVIPCKAWLKNARFLFNHCSKGSIVLILGRLVVRKYKNNEGNSSFITEVVVNMVQTLPTDEGE